MPEVPEDDNAKLVTVNLPEGDGTITVTLLLDGVQYGEDFTVALASVHSGTGKGQRHTGAGYLL